MSADWQSHIIGDLLETIIDYRGKTPPKSKNGIPTLTAANVKGGRIDLSSVSYVSKEIYDQWTTRGFPEPGDVIITTEAPVGEVAPFPSDQTYLITRRVMALRGKKGVLDNDFLLFVLQSPIYKDKLLTKTRGSTVSRVLKTDITGLEIALPSINEQKKIAGVLKKIDTKIELNRQTNKTLESMAQTIFKSWFVDFEPVKAKIAAIEAGEDADGVTRAAMRAISGKTDDELNQMQAEQPENYAQLKTTAGLFPAAMQDSELGEVPEGWEIMPFSKLANLDTTSVKPHNDPDKLWEHYSIPAFDVNEAPKFELGSEIKSNKYKVNPIAILSSKLNPNTPRTWWPDVDDETSAICSTEFMQFVPTDVAQRAFIFGLITSDIFQSGIKQRVTGSTGSRQRAQPRAVAEMDVIKPKEELVLAYCSRLTELYVLKAKNIKENITLANIRDALLPKLMSGDILVKAER